MFRRSFIRFIFPSRKYSLIHILITFLVFFFCERNVLCYGTGAGFDGGSIEEIPAHQHITKEAIKTWKGAPPEAIAEISSYHSRNIYSQIDYTGFVDYDPGYDDIITGSAEEDYVTGPIIFEENCSGDALNGYFEHFGILMSHLREGVIVGEAREGITVV